MRRLLRCEGASRKETVRLTCQWRSTTACPARHAQEVEALFPGVNAKDVLIVPTCQHAKVDLARVGETVEQEKDTLLERFVAWAKCVCDALERRGCWADYVDPCSGLPMLHREHAHRVYGEVDALTTLLGYATTNSGCCKIVLHPRWGSALYPATLFAQTDLQTLQQAIQEAQGTLRA